MNKSRSNMALVMALMGGSLGSEMPALRSPIGKRRELRGEPKKQTEHDLEQINSAKLKREARAAKCAENIRRAIEGKRRAAQLLESK